MAGKPTNEHIVAILDRIVREITELKETQSRLLAELAKRA